jgi:hypothetical protein
MRNNQALPLCFSKQYMPYKHYECMQSMLPSPPCFVKDFRTETVLQIRGACKRACCTCSVV